MTRYTRFFLAAVLVFFCSAGSFAQSFEGIITMEITSSKMPHPMTMTTNIKGDKTMSEMQMAQGSIKIYIDKGTGKMTSVMEAMKMGMEMDMKDIQKKAQEKTANTPPPKVEETGEKRDINGHSCSLFRVTTNDSTKSNWWMTDDLPKSILNSLRTIYNNSAGAMGSRNTGPGAGAIEEMFKKGLVPIRVESIKDGKPETTITFVKYEQKNLDDSVFAIPSDIKIQQMPAGSMGGMGGK